MNKQQAINLLKNLEQSLDDYCELNDEGETAFRMAITALEVFGLSEQLPAAQQEQRWIPCSERLPENGHYYLWCSDMGRVQSDYYWDGFENGMKYGYNIAAWTPLPEPYQGGDK